MQILSRLFGLLLLGLLAGALLLGTSSCEASRSRETTIAPRSVSTGLSGAADSRPIVQRTEEGRLAYKVPSTALMNSLSRQLDDGTVIDHLLVRQAPVDDPKDKADSPYYLIGTGQNNGRYRAIALPLRGSNDGTYFLTPHADRYVLTGTACPTCFFDFEDGHIIGSTCADGSTGGNCSLQVLSGNQVFKYKE